MQDECSTYLGQKGYSIFKEALSIEEQQYIREELTVRPYIPKAPIQPDAFPIYRESPKKLYVPRYFGVDNYGEPDKIIVNPGTDITAPFNGELRDYQKIIVDGYMNFVGKLKSGGGLIEVAPGEGKTVMSLKIISELKKKTLIVVHKTFLLNQWLERIQQFLPNMRIGKIQGQIVDIEDKDIVIGMLQSLSMKEYPQDMFDSFGLAIYDEVHHLSAEVFSKCMMKVVTNHTLGLSATMRRKDGLSKVFKMFLGDVISKKKQKPKHDVLVKGIDYITDDVEFNKMLYDYRGNPKYSSMISRLCLYNHRSEFILKVLKTELEKNPNQQIMILAHNKVLITYLYKAIDHRNIASVGYYIGGMKEAALKESEHKKVIIGTYAMASEGLDIKTLTTLIMATPKTDVCQSVGRILRTKDTKPMVIDIIDQHEVFKKQWGKRRTYYMRQKYNIIHTNNNLYESDNWETVYEPGDKSKKYVKKIKEKDEPLKGKCLINI